MSDDMTLTDHLGELRRCLVISAAAWLIAFLISYAFGQRLFEFISIPVRQALPEGSSLVFINATEPFFTILKVAALAGLIGSFPIIIWQLWRFVAPGLYKHEKRLAIPFVICSSACFGIGTFFGFTFVFPMVFSFLVTYGVDVGGIQAMLSMGAYLTLATRLLIAFGVVFELPIIIFFLSRLGIVDHKWLAKKRKFALLMAFVIGAVLTPPDLFSQASIAIPFIVLYEVGIIVARLFGKKKVVDEFADEDEDTDEKASR
jgi:sec-independent protein translocase protein TatC